MIWLCTPPNHAGTIILEFELLSLCYMFCCETLKIRCKVVFQTLNKEQLTRVVLKLCSGVLLKSCVQSLQLF